jgi:hypothetical protein
MKVQLSMGRHIGPPVRVMALLRDGIRVRGGPVSQRRLHHLTCGRVRGSVPHQNASCTRHGPGEAQPTWNAAARRAADDEDGRAPRLTAGAVALAVIACYTRIATPSGTTPVST